MLRMTKTFGQRTTIAHAVEHTSTRSVGDYAKLLTLVILSFFTPES